MSLSSQDWNELLKELFYFYTNAGNRLNRNFLTFLKLQKLLSDAGLAVTPVQSLELMFHKETKHRPHMSLEMFLNFLPRLTAWRLPELFDENPKEALSTLLGEHFLPLYKNKVMPQRTAEIDDEVCSIISSILVPLRKLYKIYFPWELTPSMKQSAKMNESQKALHLFLKDFDICPSLVSKPSAFQMWNDVVVCASDSAGLALLPNAAADEGHCLTFSRFLYILYLCALSAYSHDSQLTDCRPSEKLLILLERMELSRNHKKSTNNRPQTARDSLLPTKDVMESVIYGGAQASPEASVQEEQPLPSNVSALCLDPDGLQFLQEHIDTLHYIFQSYCSFGEPMNTTRLKSSKLLKLLKDCKLIAENRGAQTFDITTSRVEAEGLCKVDVDLIFSKLTGSYANQNRKKAGKGFGPASHLSLQSSTSYGRMEFQEFLKALEMIAEKVFPNTPLESAYRELLERYILPLDIQVNKQKTLNNEYTQVLMDLLQNEEVIEVLGLAHQVMTPYFMYYADSKGLMNFGAFMKFCKDFGVFPSVVSKAKLLKFFYTLAGIQARTDPDPSRSVQADASRAPGQTELELIDQHLFIEALALIAAEIPFSDHNLTPVQRFCYFVERLSQSSGPTIVGTNLTISQPTVRKVDILAPFRKNYPEIFAYSNSAPRNPTFSELMD